MKHLVRIGMISTGCSVRSEEDVGHESFLMEILASLSIGAIAILMILFARLSLILDMRQGFILKLLFSMGKATSISKFTVSSKFPVLAHFGLIFTLVFFYEGFSFFDGVEFLSSGADINNEVVSFLGVEARRRRAFA